MWRCKYTCAVMQDVKCGRPILHSTVTAMVHPVHASCRSSKPSLTNQRQEPKGRKKQDKKKKGKMPDGKRWENG